jgi:vacuole morphology and inheritance protein 14
VFAFHNQFTHSDVVVDDEIQQSTALRWLAEFLNFAHEVMLPFTPRLIPAILPNLAHHAAMIKTAAIRTNKLLLNVIQNLSSPSDGLTKSPRPISASAPAFGMQTTAPLRQPTAKDGALSPEPEAQQPGLQIAEKVQEKPAPKSRLSTNDIARVPSMEAIFPSSAPSRPLSPTSVAVTAPATATLQIPPEEPDLFDYQATVNALTIQFLSEFEETRVAAIKWLIMLHQKAPKKVSA